MYRLMRKMNVVYLALAIFFLSSFCPPNTDFYYHKVPAQKGDNISAFLQRYELHTPSCNVKQFLKLNELSDTDQLIAGKPYYLPAMIYTYNGKSIRSTINIDTWQQAIRIKKYNEKLLKNNLRKQTIAASNVLWVPFSELFCESGAPALADKEKTNVHPTSPDKSRMNAQKKVDDKVLASTKKISGYRKFSIFGEKHAYIPLKDNSLRGKVFYVVSGHGGPDVGAIGERDNKRLCEDEYAYDVSLRVVRNLLEHGALAYMITRDPNDGLRDGKYLECDYDEYCWGDYRIPRSQKSRLYQRSDAINTLYERHRKQGITEQYTVVIHIDSRSNNANTDVFFYYYPGSKSGRKLAKNMHNTLRKKYGTHRKNGKYKGTVNSRDLHMLREPKTASVFIELGNIRNRYDQQRFMLANNRQALANWLYEGLIKH